MSEVWVDVPTVEMAPMNTWESLSVDQLIDTKTVLLDKIYAANGRSGYLKPLEAALERLDGLIQSKLSEL